MTAPLRCVNLDARNRCVTRTARASVTRGAAQHMVAARAFALAPASCCSTRASPDAHAAHFRALLRIFASPARDKTCRASYRAAAA